MGGRESVGRNHGRAADRPPAIDSPGGWWPGLVLAIVTLAGTVRVAYVLSLRATPWFDHLVVDPEYYDAWAATWEKAAFMKAQGVESGGEGEEEKDKRGGDLSDVGKKRTAEWLKTFLKNPKPEFKDDADCQDAARKKDRKKFKGTDQEFDGLVAFLMTLKQEAKQPAGFKSCLKE